MSNTFNINGKIYKEEEIISIYKFRQSQLDIADIKDAINEIVEDDDNEFINFVKENHDELLDLCIKSLSDWHDTQKDFINHWDKSIFDLSQDFINHTYYERAKLFR